MRKEVIASLDEKLELCLLHALKKQRITNASALMRMEYVAMFWSIFTGVVSGYYCSESENAYLRHSFIFLMVTICNSISYWILMPSQSPFNAILEEFMREEDGLFPRLTSREVKQQILALRQKRNIEQFYQSVNHIIKKAGGQYFFSALISSIIESFPAMPGWRVLVKHLVFNAVSTVMRAWIVIIKLYYNHNQVIDRPQKFMLKHLETIMVNIFKNLDIDEKIISTVYDKNDKSNRNFFISEFSRFKAKIMPEVRLNFDWEFFCNMEIRILSFKFSKKTQIINYPENVFSWRPLIAVLANEFHEELANNIFLEILHPDTFRVAILPTAIKKIQPLTRDWLQALHRKMWINDRRVKCAFTHIKALMQVTSVLCLCPWCLNLSTNKSNYLQSILSYPIDNLNEQQVTTLVKGLQAAQYDVQQDKKQLIVMFKDGVFLPNQLHKLKDDLINLAKEEKTMVKKAEKLIEKDSFDSLYFPQLQQEKTCSLMRSMWGFSDRLRRYTSSLWQQSIVAVTKKVPPVQYNFGQHGKYVENDSSDHKTAIYRLQNGSGIKTNQFILVTEQAIKEIDKHPKLIQQDVWKHIAQAKIVPHTDNKSPQKSGFVLTKECLKKSKSPIHIKLITDKTEYRLYALTAMTYTQTDGEEAVLYELDKFSILHDRTVAVAHRPKPSNSSHFNAFLR